MGIRLHEFVAGSRRQSDTLCEYLARIRSPYFLQCRSAICAPLLDRNLWEDLHVYKSLYPSGSLQANMADAAILSLTRHTWYLTEELLVFALWDGKLPARKKQAIARKMVRVFSPANYI